MPRDYELFPDSYELVALEEAQVKIRDYYHFLLNQSTKIIDGIVLSLPVEIDHQCNANMCSYFGLEGDLSKIFTNSKNIPTVILNDAESAAYGVEAEVQGKTLIITLGFGIGGALWTK